MSTMYSLGGLGWQTTPTSSLWSQLLIPIGLERQVKRVGSLPVHATLSSTMEPEPRPKKACALTTAPIRYSNPIHNIFDLLMKYWMVIVWLNTCVRMSQLPACNVSTVSAKLVITNSPPLIVIADFQSSFKLTTPTYKPQLSLSTWSYKGIGNCKVRLTLHNVIVLAYLSIWLQHLQSDHSYVVRKNWLDTEWEHLQYPHTPHYLTKWCLFLDQIQL